MFFFFFLLFFFCLAKKIHSINLKSLFCDFTIKEKKESLTKEEKKELTEQEKEIKSKRKEIQEKLLNKKIKKFWLLKKKLEK